MAKKKHIELIAEPKSGGDDILRECKQHYNDWTEDNMIRQTRANGWDDVTDAYWGKLPKDWPYISKIVDPRIRTTIIEKNARLINSKLRGRLVPRENGDMVKSKIQNAILDFQWDDAKEGGTMLSKWASMDMDARLYGSKFALVLWKYECDDEDKVQFNGNEFKPLDLRDCGIDPSADNIRNAKWFQAREWVHIEDLEHINNLSANPDDAPYKNLSVLKDLIINQKQSRRDNRYVTRVLSNKGLTDRVGTDKAFPVVELVTEYRKDRWITFSPDHNVVVRDIENPYAHKKIPVAQLKYYPIQGDVMGESEVEPALPIWRAIQAVVCGFFDSYNIYVNPPLKIVEGQVRIETIVYGPQAQWLMNNANAVMEMQGGGQALNTFQTAYLSLVSAYNTAMGEMSSGVSNIDPTQNQKTATEVEKSTAQQNTRDQRNQTVLSECIQDVMSMWLSNNRQFLLLDKKLHPYVMRIIGSEMFNYFKRAGLDEMEVSEEGMQYISDIIAQQGGNVSDGDIQELIEAGKMPKFPVVNKDKKVVSKMEINETNDQATLYIIPEDLDGDYDYIPDVKSMATGANQQMMEGRAKAMGMMQDPAIQQMLATEGVKVNIKDLLVSMMEDVGLSDAERFFTKQEQMAPMDPQQQQQMAMQGQDPNAMMQQPMDDMQAMQATGEITQDMIDEQNTMAQMSQ